MKTPLTSAFISTVYRRAILVGALLATAMSAHAVTTTWTGGSAVNSNWSQQDVMGTFSNWDSVPFAGNDYIFAGTMRLDSHNDFGSALLNTATFDNTAGAFMLTGNPVFINAGITNNSSNLQTLGFSLLSLGGSQTWTANTAALSVTASVDNAGFNLTVDGASNTTISGSITGSGSLTKDGAGALTLTNNSNYTGGTALNAGTIFADADNALGNGALTIAGGTTLGTHNSPTLANNIVVNGDFSIARANFFGLTGHIDLGGATRTITDTGTGTSLDFGGVIANGGVTFNGTAPFSLMRYSGAGVNTYTGLTTINSNVGLTLTRPAVNGSIVGDVLINGNGVLALSSNHPDQIADTSTVTVNSTGNTFGMTQFAGFELHSNAETIAALFGNGTVGLGSGTLTVGSGDFSGVILDGTFAAGGQLTKNDTGTLILSGANTYTGNTNVDGGTLQVDGSIASPTTIVAASGTLSGTGTIGGTLDNFGHVAPGDSPGTLTVLANYNQSSSARLEIEVGGLAEGVDSDLLHMNGTAALDGALDVFRINNFAPLPGDRVTILRADGGRGGTTFSTFSAIDWNGLIQPTVDYSDPLTVDIVFELVDTFLSQALTPNQMSVADEMDEVVGDPRADALIGFLGSEPMANLPHDFDLIAPEELASMYQVGFSQAVITNMNLQHRMDDIRAGSNGFCSNGYHAQETGGYSKESDGNVAVTTHSTSAFVPSPENRWGIFATGNGDFINVGDHDTNAHGYDITTGGVTVGVDYRLCDHFAVGIDGSYSGSRVDLVDRGRVDVDGGKAGAYATFFGYKILGAMIHIDGAVSGGWNSYDTNRTGLEDLPVRGSTNGTELNAMIAYGGDWHFGCLLIGTWSSVQYTNVDIDKFTETGSLAPLEIQDQNEDSLRTTTGLRVAYDIKAGNAIIRPEARAGWQHEYGDRSYPIDARLASGAGDVFTVWGPRIGRDAAVVDAGLALQWSSRFSTYVYYDGVLGRSNYDSHGVSGGLRISF